MLVITDTSRTARSTSVSSMLTKITGPWCSATCSAIWPAIAVLPVPVDAASRYSPCDSPSVIVSRSRSPVETPARPPVRAWPR